MRKIKEFIIDTISMTALKLIEWLNPDKENHEQ